MYDDFSADYDRFVDWPARLAVELPFIERQLQAVGAHRVLDVACGTGVHAIALAQRGYQVAGADLSAGMIERARTNAAAAGVEVRFEVAGFGELSETLTPALSLGGRGEEALSAPGGFDAVLCLGNSLPHLLTPEDLAAALADFAACLAPGGLVLIQNRNFDAVVASHERWMEPQSRREGQAEWLFLRFYDFEPDGLLTFNLVTLRREGVGGWSQRVTSSRLRPLVQKDLTEALCANGFAEIACWGDMRGVPFDPQASPNLVVTARRNAACLNAEPQRRGVAETFVDSSAPLCVSASLR
jgi:SAM-dependent methyltransferase